MLFRRYGSSIHRVDPDFDPNAMNEISFRRDRAASFPSDELTVGYEKLREVALRGETDGPVQTEAEARLLEDLRARLDGLVADLGEGEILLVENERGLDYPRVKDHKRGIMKERENRLHFHWTVDPPLRIGVYRRRGP